MKQLFIFFLTAIIFSSYQISSSQVVYNHKIDSVVNLVSAQSLTKMNKEMSGDTIVTIGGIPQILFSRYAPTTGNVKAAQYIFEKLQSFGLNAKYMISSSTCCNVYAEKTGTKYPGRKYIIGGHYDDIINPIPGLNDTIHGADDNASGVCAVLEAARLLANMNLDCSVTFVAFDEEENSGNGSYAFTDSLLAGSDTILGYLNLDMIAYDYNNDSKADIWTNALSENLCNVLISCNSVYQTGIILTKRFDGYSSDQIPFWAKGFKALALAELESDFNPNWHKLGDMFNKFNMPYYIKMTKLSVATLLTWATGNYFSMSHTPLKSGSDTSAKIAVLQIISSNNEIKIATGVNAPRLYYKQGTGQYYFVNAFEINGDMYKFRIPGKPAGTKITYYFAAQDSAGSWMMTSPNLGGGINPPGTIPPPSQYVYYVWTTNSYCSNKIKPITDFGWTEDTIHISQQGIVKDLDVSLNLNHTNDGDLLIKLQVPGNNTTLSQYSGQGGQNFINTIFDDSAATPISQGVPPFTGRFKPQGLLTPTFLNQQIAGDWILRIYDINGGNSGSLLNWCITFKYENPIGITNINSIVPEDYKLFQNYPNPFNPATNIRYRIVNNSFVSLKIYDLLGREIATLVNEKQRAGEYEATFNGEELPSGIYFYKLNVADPLRRTGDFSEVKKMVLIK